MRNECSGISKEPMNSQKVNSAFWVLQSTTQLRTMDSLNKIVLTKGSVGFLMILRSQIVIRLNWSNEIIVTLLLIKPSFARWFRPNMLCYIVWSKLGLGNMQVYTALAQYISNIEMQFPKSITKTDYGDIVIPQLNGKQPNILRVECLKYMKYGEKSP